MNFTRSGRGRSPARYNSATRKLSSVRNVPWASQMRKHPQTGETGSRRGQTLGSRLFPDLRVDGSSPRVRAARRKTLRRRYFLHVHIKLTSGGSGGLSWQEAGLRLRLRRQMSGEKTKPVPTGPRRWRQPHPPNTPTGTDTVIGQALTRTYQFASLPTNVPYWILLDRIIVSGSTS